MADLPDLPDLPPSPKRIYRTPVGGFTGFTGFTSVVKTDLPDLPQPFGGGPQKFFGDDPQRADFHPQLNRSPPPFSDLPRLSVPPPPPQVAHEFPGPAAFEQNWVNGRGLELAP